MEYAIASRCSMAWIILVVAGLFEIGWAIGLKYTEGFTRLWPTVGTVASMIISLGLLGVAGRPPHQGGYNARSGPPHSLPTGNPLPPRVEGGRVLSGFRPAFSRLAGPPP